MKNDKLKNLFEKRKETLIKYFDAYNKRKIYNKLVKDFKRELDSLDNYLIQMEAKK